MSAFEELEVVALTRDIAEHDLHIGELGTIVMVYEPTAFEVEFVEDSGYTKALLTLRSKDVRKLSPDELKAAAAPVAE
jgi:hypothetical protein